jgi:predicted esterase
VSWFGFRFLENSTVEVRRGVARKMVTVRAEKRRRGDPDGPLAEEMITVTARTRCDKAVDRRRKIRIVRRTADLLPAVIFRPITGPQQWTLIYLHGLGSSFWNYIDKPHYFVDGTIALKIVVPTAPQREVSCFDGWWVPKQQRKNQADGSSGRPAKRYQLQKFASWYDYLSNHDGRREDAIDWKSLGAIQRALHGIIQREAAELGGRPDRIIIGGKSQGCCTALDALLTYPRPLGGFVGVVGHLLGCSPVEPGGPQAQTPLHFFHEPEDAMMRWEWVQHGERRLREAGYAVHSRHCPDPEKNGHFIDGVEGTWVRSAVRSICTPKRVS